MLAFLTNRYPKSVQKLVILAGISGSGKSTFAQDPGRFLEHRTYGTDLGLLSDSSIPHIDTRDLGKCRSKSFHRLKIHFDISAPLRKMPFQDHDYQNMNSFVSVKMFESFERIAETVRVSEGITVLTFFVNRKENFRRLVCGRTASVHRASKLDRILNPQLLMICGDSTRNSELHRNIYRTWLDFIETQRVVSHTVIDGSSLPYRLTTVQEFRELLDSGYE